MLKLVLHRNRVNISVLPPQYPTLLGPLVRFLSKRRAPRPGLRIPGGRTFVSLAFVDEKTALVPVALSADHRRLLCYTTRFSNGDVAVLIIAGRSISSICCDGALRNALVALHLECSSRGPITEHRLTEFAPDRRPVEALACRISLIALKSFIMHPQINQHLDLPPLNHTTVSLQGWSVERHQLPTCTFKSSRDNMDVLVKIAWGRRRRDSETVNVTTPQASYSQAA